MLNFKELRDQWALMFAARVTKARIEMWQENDRYANPHNDSYHNKRKRRSEAEIISDVSYNDADEALKQSYGDNYSRWLRENTQEPDNQSQARRYKLHFQEYTSAA